MLDRKWRRFGLPRGGGLRNAARGGDAADDRVHKFAPTELRPALARKGVLQRLSLRRRGCTLSRAPHEVVNEAQLLHDRWRDDERIEIGSAHRAIDAVHGDDERRPGVDNPLDRTDRIRVEVELGEMRAFFVDRRRDPEPERARRFERVHDVEVMGPGFGEILPRMRGCVSRDKALRPIGGGALLVVALQRRFIVLRIVSERRAALLELAAVSTRMSQ